MNKLNINYSCKPFQHNTEITPNNLCSLTQNQQLAILSIIQNSNFLVKMAGSTKLARSYFNENKEWCLTLDLSKIKGYHNKTILLRTFRTTTNIIENNKCNAVNINNLFTYGPKNDKEKIFFYYYKNRNFFIEVLSAIRWAITTNANFKYYCKKIILPNDFNWNLSDKERVFMLTGKDILFLFGKIYPNLSFKDLQNYCIHNLFPYKQQMFTRHLYYLPDINKNNTLKNVPLFILNSRIGGFNYRNPN